MEWMKGPLVGKMRKVLVFCFPFEGSWFLWKRGNYLSDGVYGKYTDSLNSTSYNFLPAMYNK